MGNVVAHDYSQLISPQSMRALARAKILQALIDLRHPMCATKGEAAAAQTLAWSFLFSFTSDLARWCDMAELHPDDVRRKAKDIYENGLDFKGYDFRADHTHRPARKVKRRFKWEKSRLTK